MWGIVWPFLLAAWAFLFQFLFFRNFGRKDAGTDVATDLIRWRPVQRGLRWVFYLAVGYGGLILVVCLPSWFYWGQLHVRGVPVSARVLKSSLEYDAENSRHFTRVTYEFEAEVDGQRRTFQREGKLRGWHFPVCVQVLYDATDPSDSRMALEASDAHDLLLSLASFLVLGVASFLVLRRLSHAGADAGNARDKVPPADGTGVARRRVKPERRTRRCT